MALRALFVFLSFAGAFGEDVAAALASDDVCEAGQDCSLELNQLRGIKVHYLEALEDEEEESTQVEEDAELEGGGCTDAADMGGLEGRRKEELRCCPQPLRPLLRRRLSVHQGPFATQSLSRVFQHSWREMRKYG